MDLPRKLWLALLLAVTFLLPVKFTHPAGIPDIPAGFPSDIFSLIYETWSAHFFVFISGLLFLFTLFRFYRERGRISGLSAWQFLLMLFLALSAFAGSIHASCTEYARQYIDFFMGLACYGGSVFLALQLEKDLAPKLLIALASGTVITLFAGYDQIAGAIQEAEDFVYAHGLDRQLSDNVKRQLTSDRIFGTFNLCNTYAGFLAAMLPLFLAGIWKWAGSHVRPPRAAQLLLSSVVLILFAVPIWMTGSRGAVLSLAAGIFLTAFFAVKTKKMRLLLSGAAVFAVFGIALLIIFRRGADSILFRLDYDLAALKMMLSHPLAGTGWGDFFYEYPALKLLCNDELPRSPHNFPLLMGSQCGIFSFLAAIALLALPLFAGFRKLIREQKTDLYFASVLAALAVLSINSLMEVGAEVPGYAATLFLLGMIVLHDAQPEENARPFSLKIFLILCVTALFTVTYAAWELRKEYLFAKYADIAGLWADPARSSDGQKEYTAALKAAEDSPFVRAMRIRDLLRQGRTAEAEKLLDAALLLAPQDSSLYRLKYRLLRHRAASAEECEKVKEQILTLDPGNPENSKL